MFDMIGNIFKNLASKPATRKYPFEKREPFKDSRGQISGIDIDACIFCGICSRKCPSDALVVNKAEKSWEIDQFKCIVCGVCTEVCPKKCIFMNEDYKTSAYKKDKEKYIQQPKPVEAEENMSKAQ
ncbi:MAG: 4Fe-4S dicluster domain-containing protein [Clostridia bacterium]|nr:4Fe-4S dicluster domain-containing protein [Clostridia bacterium]